MQGGRGFGDGVLRGGLGLRRFFWLCFGYVLCSCFLFGGERERGNGDLGLMG